MLVVELALDDGYLINAYVMIRFDAEDVRDFLRAVGDNESARAVGKGKWPDVEIETYIGREVTVSINNGSVTF